VNLLREGPYRQPAASRGTSSEPPAPARQLLTITVTAIVLALLAAPVAALASQPFSFYATLVTGALAAWTAVAWILIGFAAD
jgi:hypothetical protein